MYLACVFSVLLADDKLPSSLDKYAKKVRRRRRRYVKAWCNACTWKKRFLRESCTVDFPYIIPDRTSVYTCTSEWGLHFPEANGDSQSPININSRDSLYDESLNRIALNANYMLCRECEITNTGQTVQISLRYKTDPTISTSRDGKTEMFPRSVMTGGPLPEGYDFELTEFCFHWGKDDERGSEHTVNLKAYPMELHLIHWNSTLYSSLEEAMGKPDGICIVSLFIQIGREHAGLRMLTDILEAVQYKGKSYSLQIPFNPNCLLPDPALRDFWTYEGSLTTPPCFENVTWILFRYPLTVSHAQLENFRRMRTHLKGDVPSSEDDGHLVDNYRPTQPLNGRVVKASFQ
ncbi:carbonic anhydrase-related protein-like isoform X2 [Anneissia japonica]|uniref:carbonic anhydrase-related protein-like isoform X2 n=1 Tax=Anneissia japonica TaxID=1529436 RepID=UPI001425931B|nr:carbonic anhydrase-related protein-like isoform X2 [Anneissia japonica]